MAMSLQAYAHNAHIKTPTSVDGDRGGLDNTPASASDRDLLRAHLGREVLHGSIGRNFSKAYIRNADGSNSPRMYRFGTEALGRCEYVMLTNKQYAAVLVVDVDQVGTAGGDPADLNPYVRDVVRLLISHNIGPAWVGINPTNGKAQFIWLIDPVYANHEGKSAQMKLLAATTRVLGELLDHDSHFSHRFSRNPFYTGKAPTAYRWYKQHNRVMRLGDLGKEGRGGEEPHRGAEAPDKARDAASVTEGPWSPLTTKSAGNGAPDQVIPRHLFGFVHHFHQQVITHLLDES